MPTNEDLAASGMAIFRGMVTRINRRLCTKRVARDRYCQRQTITDRGLFCEQHERESEADHRRLVANGWEDLDDGR